MSVTGQIVATYTGPRKVMRRLLTMPFNEGRALAIALAGCGVIFVGQWPRLAREAHMQDEEIYPLIGGALLGWMFIMPLVLYLLAFISHLIAQAASGEGAAYGARLALFWAMLASSPVMLLCGMIAGFVGPGPGLTLVQLLWLLVLLWVWLASLYEVNWSAK